MQRKHAQNRFVSILHLLFGNTVQSKQDFRTISTWLDSLVFRCVARKNMKNMFLICPQFQVSPIHIPVPGHRYVD